MTNENGETGRAIRLRLVLRGFMEVEAFDVEAFSGAAHRANQKLLGSAAVRKKKWILASLDIDKACLKGLAYKELAAATGEQERLPCFAPPPASAAVVRQLPAGLC